MKVTISVQRSKEWVAEQRLHRGENVPDTISCDVEASSLSIPCRRVLLQQSCGGKKYPKDVNQFVFTDRFAWSGTSYGYGHFKPQVDADSPTTAEIDAAILLIDQQLKGRREEWEEAEAKREATRKVEAAKKAAKVAARELLAEEIESIKNDNRKYQGEVITLSEFLCCVPLDALRGTVKNICHNADATDELIKKIEDASTAWIFSNRDDK